MAIEEVDRRVRKVFLSDALVFIAVTFFLLMRQRCFSLAEGDAAANVVVDAENDGGSDERHQPEQPGWAVAGNKAVASPSALKTKARSLLPPSAVVATFAADHRPERAGPFPIRPRGKTTAPTLAPAKRRDGDEGDRAASRRHRKEFAEIGAQGRFRLRTRASMPSMV